ncbi:protoporphyrinogen oxidase [Actinoplanes derwentensis]|uniref:Coproporphyrinogen III oxidase n=1 Tax=Actinoplanes derwentensis TaxID=113562 RepID=A0A1H2D787_9ACTN|nr:protoporphyrinogen oxidase [Actinoplanes derwentensis]GID85654.1 protoporphyrinogen oxidase [Actinoplanes derwentensis]SDT78116.1 oxygen-dependent protoporphyrinogen oxidase [Actinoplanes derwentensis]
MRKRIAIIGGGIAGLAAAVRLRDLDPQSEILVYERSGSLGGKLHTGALGGLTVERGAESFLNSAADGGDSAAVALAHRLGLSLVHPAARPAALAIEGRLAPIPGGTLVGVPGDLSTLDGVALPMAHADRDTGRPLLAPGQDIAVGALVRDRYGDEVVDRLVDPMLGGVYAGRADRLSLRVTMPQLAHTAETERTLSGAVRAAQARSKRVPGRPIFAAVDGGMSRLVSAAAAESGARVVLDATVRELTRTAAGRWKLIFGPVPSPRVDEVDAVILAVPASAAARLLGSAFALDYASVALAGLAFTSADLPDMSGFLVPAGEGTLVKAATFFTTKWPHLARDGGPVIVRVSLGRAGEQDRLQLDDASLLAVARRELSDLIGVELPEPADSWVQRWGGGLPQYAPGHADRVADFRAALPEGIAVAGAAFDGVGIPVCVASGERAADDVSKFLKETTR